MYNYLKNYNELHGEEQLRKIKLIKKATQHLELGKILDIGCGTGITSKIIKPNLGIEPSLLRNQIKNFKVLNAKAEKLPLKNESFDTTICLTTIHNTNYKKSLQEIKRVTKKYIIITVLKKSKKYNEIINKIKEEFKLIKQLDDLHDTILITKKE